MTKVLVLYYSSYGHIEQMAKAAAEGVAKVSGVTAVVKRVPETVPLEIAKLGALKGAELNEAKKILATEATALMHGRAAAEEAAETARKTFEEGAFAESLPTVEIPRGDLDAGVGVLVAFA